MKPAISIKFKYKYKYKYKLRSPAPNEHHRHPKPPICHDRRFWSNNAIISSQLIVVSTKVAPVAPKLQLILHQNSITCTKTQRVTPERARLQNEVCSSGAFQSYPVQANQSTYTNTQICKYTNMQIRKYTNTKAGHTRGFQNKACSSGAFQSYPVQAIHA